MGPDEVQYPVAPKEHEEQSREDVHDLGHLVDPVKEQRYRRQAA